MMNGLFVYSATRYNIDNRIEVLKKGNVVEQIEPGERLLDPGIYRLGEGVTATRIDAAGATASATPAELLPVPNDKGQWPDPPVVDRVNEVLELSRDDVLTFFGGADVRATI